VEYKCLDTVIVGVVDGAVVIIDCKWIVMWRRCCWITQGWTVLLHVLLTFCQLLSSWLSQVNWSLTKLSVILILTGSVEYVFVSAKYRIIGCHYHCKGFWSERFDKAKQVHSSHQNYSQLTVRSQRV